MNVWISIWAESHKICKAWVLINQILSRRFGSYGLSLNKSNHRVKQVDISESTDINQSIELLFLVSIFESHWGGSRDVVYLIYHLINLRGSRPNMLWKIVSLRHFEKFKGEHLHRNPSLVKLQVYGGLKVP